MPHLSFADPATVTVTPDTPPPTTFQSLAVYDKSSQFSNVFKSKSLAGYLNAIFTTVLSIGAILAVLRIAYAGYIYMGSADMWGNKQQAKEILGDAVIGLLLLFGIYLVLNQINPNLLNLNILRNINPVNQGPTVTSAGVDDRVTPATGIPDGTACTITGMSGSLANGIEQGGTCRFAP